MAEELQVEKNVGPDFLVISHQWSGHNLTWVPLTVLNSLEIGDGTRFWHWCILPIGTSGRGTGISHGFGLWHGYYSYYNTLSLSCCPTKFLIFTDLMSLQPPMSILGVSNLDSILKSRDITLPTKVHLVKAMVFPVVRYGCELDCEESWAP